MKTRMVFHIDFPQPEETLRSVLERAGQLLDLPAEELWHQLNEEATEPPGDVDDPSCAALGRLAHALGCTPCEVARHRLPDHAMLLMPEARRSKCPLCVTETEAGACHSIARQAWSSVLATHCDVHGTPLVMSHPLIETPMRQYGAAMNTLSVDDVAILELIGRFARELGGACVEGSSWPYAPTCSVADVKTLLVEMVTVTGKRSLPASVASVTAPTSLRPFVHGPLHWCNPVRRRDWEHFRQIADPSIRRAALWAVAWLVVPGLDRRFFPGWIGRTGINDSGTAIGGRLAIGRAA